MTTNNLSSQCRLIKVTCDWESNSIVQNVLTCTKRSESMTPRPQVWSSRQIIAAIYLRTSKRRTETNFRGTLTTPDRHLIRLKCWCDSRNRRFSSRTRIEIYQITIPHPTLSHVLTPSERDRTSRHLNLKTGNNWFGAARAGHIRIFAV